MPKTGINISPDNSNILYNNINISKIYKVLIQKISEDNSQSIYWDHVILKTFWYNSEFKINDKIRSIIRNLE